MEQIDDVREHICSGQRNRKKSSLNVVIEAFPALEKITVIPT